ncbi:hypothetical protein F5X99DRAFT_406754 [Biscogniauxia marginata]|nr:hypothetical protein F5X99DRAFT_406754 [Biscogniauxia marginata]
MASTKTQEMMHALAFIDTLSHESRNAKQIKETTDWMRILVLRPGDSLQPNPTMNQSMNQNTYVDTNVTMNPSMSTNPIENHYQITQPASSQGYCDSGMFVEYGQSYIPDDDGPFYNHHHQAALPDTVPDATTTAVPPIGGGSAFGGPPPMESFLNTFPVNGDVTSNLPPGGNKPKEKATKLCEEPSCPKVFDSDWALRRHTVYVHVPKECLPCNMAFKSLRQCAQHMVEVHGNGDSSKCHICGKGKDSWRREDQFFEHVMMHALD